MIFNWAIRMEYLFVDKYDFKEGWVFQKSTVPYAMFRFIVKGKAKFIINDMETEVEAGHIVYIPQTSLLYCEALEDDVTFISIRFTSSVQPEYLDIWTDQYGVAPIALCEDAFIVECFHRILEERNSSNISKVHKIRGYLEFIMAYMIEQGCMGQQSKNKHDDPYSIKNLIKRNLSAGMKIDLRIQTAVEYLIINQNKRVKLEDLHKMVNLSPSAFRRVFKKHTGKSPKDFLAELRMMNAARQLLSTDERIAIIAESLQFEDANYFSRQFRKTFGVTPKEYRRLSR